MKLLGCLLAAALLAGCPDDGGDTTASDTTIGGDMIAGDVIAGDTGHDALSDASDADEDVRDTVDSDVSSADSGSGDVSGDAGDQDTGAAVPLAGFGALTGTCGVLDTELTDTAPDFFVNHLDFAMDPYDDSDLNLLTPGGQQIIADGNAGGSSIHSEVFAYEVLARCELAALLKTETHIDYDPKTKLTDFLVDIDGLKIGVSVTRAVGFPKDDPYTVAQAKSLLEGKLADILISSANVVAADAWEKQILHVLAYADMHAASLETAWGEVDAATRADTIVIVTVSDGDDAFIY